MARPKKSDGKVDDRHLRLEYMGGRCAVCRRSIAAVERRFLTSKGVFEFNHVDPSQKSPIYEKLIRRTVSAAQLDELDKCNLLCRICHGIWHNQWLRGKVTLTINLPDGRVVKKLIHYHGMIEFKKEQPHFHFFADEPTQLDTYAYVLGNGKRIYRLGFELVKDLGRLMLATRRRRTLRVWDEKGLVFSADRMDDQLMECTYFVRFPILKAEFQTNDPDCPFIWSRNGKVIIRGHGIRKSGRFRMSMEYAPLEQALATKDGSA